MDGDTGGTLASPLSMTPVKLHVPMKCGYICLDCRVSHINPEKLFEQPCDGRLVGFKSSCHRIVKAAVQCQNCSEVGDNQEEFMQENCGGQKTASPSSTEIHTSLFNDPVPENVSLAEEAEQKLQKLKILKQLEDERKELHRLLGAQSRNSCILTAPASKEICIDTCV